MLAIHAAGAPLPAEEVFLRSMGVEPDLARKEGDPPESALPMEACGQEKSSFERAASLTEISDALVTKTVLKSFF